MKTKTIIYILVGVLILGFIIYFLTKKKKGTSTSILLTRRLGGVVINPSEPRPIYNHENIIPIRMANPQVDCASLKQQLDVALNNMVNALNKFKNESNCWNGTPLVSVGSQPGFQINQSNLTNSHSANCDNLVNLYHTSRSNYISALNNYPKICQGNN